MSEDKRLNKLIVAALLVLIAGGFYGGYILSRRPTVTGTRIEFRGVVLNVELAKTSEDQQRGLGYRDSMAPDHGMLFVFNSEDTWGFWMSGMRFPLDIIWFDSQRHAVYIEQGLVPCTPQSCPIYTPTVKAMYVLEVNAGFVQAHDVSLGDTFNFVS
jgi:uncharacterized membrane protein (UPF0127 family)